MIDIAEKSDIKPIDERLARIEQLLENTVLSTVPEVMTLAQLCQYWQVSQPSINLWINTQGLPVHYVGADPRFHKSEVDTWSRESGKKKFKRAKAA